MARLINFNTITFSTGMSKNTRPENLAEELAALPEALKTVSLSQSGQAVVLARVVNGISPEAWGDASRAFSLDSWHAFPLRCVEGDEEDLEATVHGVLHVSPFREVPGALTRGMFASLLERELLRLGRNGGTLSLVAATLASRKEVTTALGVKAVDRLDAMLGSTLLERLDACDALGLTRRGVFLCSLPGLGQLAARHFAESCQRSFAAVSRPFFPAGGLSAGSGGGCAIGIINIMQGETCTVADLFKRARAALDAALRKDGGQIHQESAMAPFEGTTLVHSSEKRFLFFGGDPS